MVVCGKPHVITETVEKNKFLKRFNNFIITVTQQDIDEFEAIDNESTVPRRDIRRSKPFLQEQQLVN